MVVFRFLDRTWDPCRESKIFFSQNLTYSYSFLGSNLPGIIMSLESLDNYFGITVKIEKTMKNLFFSNFACDSEIMLKWLQHHGSLHQISPQKTLRSTFFFTKKNSVRHPKMVVFRFWERTWNPLRESKIFFSHNLTYSYSLLGCNLPGITMSLESLHNYFGITVKSRKNDEKFGFFDFCLWSRNNVGIIATSW